MAVTRTHVVLPEELVEEIDNLVGRRGRSSFLADAARQELKRRRLLRFLRQPQPAWRDEDHPELAGGAAAWVSRMRTDGERRDIGRRGR
ncbi:MAG: hypothetical protein WD696_15465 [Bryobacteraceae bacterium]